MKTYEITQTDKKLIDIALKVLAENFDDGNLVKVTASDLLPFAWKPVVVE